MVEYLCYSTTHPANAIERWVGCMICGKIYIGKNRKSNCKRHKLTHSNSLQQPSVSLHVAPVFNQEENQYGEQEAYGGHDDLVSVADSAINDAPVEQYNWQHQCKSIL